MGRVSILDPALDVPSTWRLIGRRMGNVRRPHSTPLTIEATGVKSALNPEILCRCFAFVRDFVVFDNLPLIETAETGLLDSRYMDKHIFSAILRLNKSVPFLRIEPLHGAARHSRSPLLTFDDSLAEAR
jgi:hypothetical protein